MKLLELSILGYGIQITVYKLSTKRFRCNIDSGYEKSIGWYSSPFISIKLWYIGMVFRLLINIKE